MVVGVISNCGGNVGSVISMLETCNIASKSIERPESIIGLDGLILPGVGRFDKMMERLNSSGMAEAIRHYITNGDGKFLGICVGMQVLFESSAESKIPGLNIFSGKLKKFPSNNSVSICPNMGWKYISVVNDTSPFVNDEETRFYFVHSYYLEGCDTDLILAKSHNGFEFPCAVGTKNVLGVQFHPEKSHRFGQKFFKDYFNA
jgi:glutamine amidotransferase